MKKNKIEILKEKAIDHYQKYKEILNEIYELDELEGDKLFRYIEEQL